MALERMVNGGGPWEPTATGGCADPIALPVVAD